DYYCQSTDSSSNHWVF
nr:immunoglobulin light chain junction region [Macaca mulatta]MOW66984.1 immunoglobulin light chain junction region [Macaca mulatta]MOW69751.1 immunoglobulin light chain junction region [Macaca mulatta]MOW69881.1 immunoglobulin light chain junction region [Macaca mulatta]MOW69988.1 immunoglobulin light chain junction region [Macaca mulatta]